MIGDALAVVSAYSIAFILRVKISGTPIHNSIPANTYLQSLLLLVPFIIIIFSVIGLYQTSQRHTASSTVGRLLLGAFLAMIFMVFIDYFYTEHVFPAKKVPLYGLAISIVLLGWCEGCSTWDATYATAATLGYLMS